MKVTLQELTKIFPSRNKNDGEVIAVNNVNLDIPDGKLVGLLGPSGCGKSTTLYMISGLLTPSKGSIFFGEDDVTKLSPENRGVGLVFQNYALYPHMSVKQNILFPLQNLKGQDKMSKEEMLDRAYSVAKLVQIDELMDRKPSELSGGQQQRVAIARALAKMPRVLLLDEPLSNLDARLRLQTREEIKRIQRETNITTVFVTHDQDEAMSISDIIVVMKLGIVQQIGEPQAVYDSPNNLFVAKFLGIPPINVLKGVLDKGSLYIGKEKVFDFGDVEGFYKDRLEDANSKLESLNDDLAKVQATKMKESVKKVKIERINAAILETEEAINTIKASLKNKKHEVYVGIRPEGFVVDPEGVLTVELDHIEIMGRDVSVISKHPENTNPIIRSIVPAEEKIDPAAKSVKFSLKRNKVFIFDKMSEMRIFEAGKVKKEAKPAIVEATPVKKVVAPSKKEVKPAKKVIAKLVKKVSKPAKKVGGKK